MTLALGGWCYLECLLHHLLCGGLVGFFQHFCQRVIGRQVVRVGGQCACQMGLGIFFVAFGCHGACAAYLSPWRGALGQNACIKCERFRDIFLGQQQIAFDTQYVK